VLCNSILVRVIKSLRGTGGLVQGGEPVIASGQAGKPGLCSYTLPLTEHEILPPAFFESGYNRWLLDGLWLVRKE
jgi:hypothetical protein